MRRAIALVLSLTLSGCAAHRAPVAQGADPLHDWASVVALPHKAAVRVTLDYDIDGRLDDVTGSTLTILVPPGMPQWRISRDHVVRVAVLTPKRMPWRWLAKPLVVGLVGGLVGAIVGAVMRDGEVAGRSLAVFGLSAIGAYFHILHHVADHEWRTVYERR